MEIDCILCHHTQTRLTEIVHTMGVERWRRKPLTNFGYAVTTNMCGDLISCTIWWICNVDCCVDLMPYWCINISLSTRFTYNVATAFRQIPNLCYVSTLTVYNFQFCNIFYSNILHAATYSVLWWTEHFLLSFFYSNWVCVFAVDLQIYQSYKSFFCLAPAFYLKYLEEPWISSCTGSLH